MTLVAVKRGPWYPERIVTDGGDPTLALTLNVASEVAGYIFKFPKAGNVDRVIYSLGAVSITSGPLNFDARLEGLSSTGLNSGVLLGTNSNGADSIADTDDNTQREITLTDAVAVTKGQDGAFVLAAPGSGTFSVELRQAGGDFTGKFPYAFNDSSKTARVPFFLLRYDDGTYVAPAGCYAIRAIGSSTITSATNPDEIGNRFQYPFPCKIDAISMLLNPNSSADFTVRIYDDSNNVLLEQTFDSDNHVDYGDGSMTFDLDDEIEVAANTWYRVTIRPSASNHQLYYYEVGSTSYLDAMEGGQNIYATSRENDGGWTNTTNRRYFISTRLSALDDGAGGGGVFGLQGGFGLIQR